MTNLVFPINNAAYIQHLFAIRDINEFALIPSSNVTPMLNAVCCKSVGVIYFNILTNSLYNLPIPCLRLNISVIGLYSASLAFNIFLNCLVPFLLLKSASPNSSEYDCNDNNVKEPSFFFLSRSRSDIICLFSVSAVLTIFSKSRFDKRIIIDSAN